MKILTRHLLLLQFGILLLAQSGARAGWLAGGVRSVPSYHYHPQEHHAVGGRGDYDRGHRQTQIGSSFPVGGDAEKVSLKIDINALVPGQDWRGLKK